MGRHLLRRINARQYKAVYCLSKTDGSITPSQSSLENITVLEGDILEPNSYAPYLADSDVVVHLAAATGKVPTEEYFDVNARGTKVLINQCERCRIERFIHMSSIAVNYRDLSRYHYAQSKQRGEDAVRKSSLNYTILRPTIVIGKKAPVWRNLSRLAKGPLTIILGCGKTKMQPIYIDDLMDCLLSVVNENVFANQTLEIGGPQIITFHDFLIQIQKKYHGTDTPTIHMPLAPMRLVMGCLEKHFYSLLPINVGQLEPFTNDSTIQNNSLFLRHRPHMKNVDQMLDIVIGLEKDEIEKTTLCDECKVFCQHLINQAPNDYVLMKYVDAHRLGEMAQPVDLFKFESLLLYFARISPLCAKLADTYTRIILRHSLIRKKLVLLLAILECSRPYYSFFDNPDSSAYLPTSIRLFQKSFVFVITLLVSMICLGSLHIVFSILARLQRSD